MALRKFVERMTKSVDDVDREKLTAWCDAAGVVPMDQIVLRQPILVAGEVRSVRIVPRAGAPALEATVQDGRGSVTAVFLGRRKIPGVSPGRRVQLLGVVTKDEGEQVVYNPVYTLM
jgi:RecJ-like exonuclease